MKPFLIRLALLFLACTIFAGVIGFGGFAGLAPTAIGMAKVLFFVFGALTLAILMQRKRPVPV